MGIERRNGGRSWILGERDHQNFQKSEKIISPGTEGGQETMKWTTIFLINVFIFMRGGGSENNY